MNVGTGAAPANTDSEPRAEVTVITTNRKLVEGHIRIEVFRCPDRSSAVQPEEVVIPNVEYARPLSYYCGTPGAYYGSKGEVFTGGGGGYLILAVFNRNTHIRSI